MTSQDVRSHCNEIDRCNQRGGRMLSIVDLLEAGTVSPELAGYLLAAIGKYQSFMVGALPGGAGKTAVMGALLNFVPTDVELVPADGRRTVQQGLKDRSIKCGSGSSGKGKELLRHVDSVSPDNTVLKWSSALYNNRM